MAGDAFFLKKKSRPRQLGAAKPGAGAGPSRPVRPRPATRPPPKLVGLAAAKAKQEEEAKAVKAENIVEIQIVSAEPGSGLRYNLMKMNMLRDVDPSQIASPMLLNRKQPGPKAPPQFAHDAEGKIIGRYVYDENGKPVLDDEGKPKIEIKQEMDMSLVGTAPGQTNKRRGKRNTKEVFHQDLEVIKLRREEANPWVLEAKNSTEGSELPEFWVGRMQEPSTLPTVLLVNEGEGATFTMVPLGRTYRFDPQRRFKMLDPDQANRYFELQDKHHVHDRWGLRTDDSGNLKVDESNFIKNSNRVKRFEAKVEEGLSLPGEETKPSLRARNQPKAAKGYYDSSYFDDYKAENRQMGRALEGGFDEELDYDMNEDFQDDEDSNTFYVNREEEEEKKLQEERQKEEYKLANRNVGDRPQLEENSEDDDEENQFSLTSEGRRLRRMMRKRGEEERDLYGSDSDDDSDSDLEELEREREREKEKEEEKKKEERNGSRAGSAQPGERSSNSPNKKAMPKAGAGAALLAKRAASRGASPSVRSRAGSPLARGSSPDGRASSPVGRADSPAARAGSPAARAGSPAVRAGSTAVRSGSPAVHGKRKATESPMRDTPPSTGEDGQQKKKKKSNRGSATPVPEIEPFPDMLTREEVIQWFKARGAVYMKDAVQSFIPRLRRGTKDEQQKNQTLLLGYIRQMTEATQPGQGKSKKLQLKAEYNV